MSKQLKAFERILQEAGKPLHYTNIADIVVSKNYANTSAKEFPQSVGSIIRNDIKNNKDNSPFVKTGIGIYGLKSFPDSITSFEGNSELEIKKNSEGNVDMPTIYAYQKRLSLNTILYGPPGTGKTYTTLEKAVQCAEPAFQPEGENERDKRASYREKYEVLIEEGRIQFITFHQSLSYEDFIEGIKPLDPTDGDTFLKYCIRDGIFKKMCLAAQTPNQKGFQASYTAFLEELGRLGTETLKLKTPKGATFAISLNGNGNPLLSG